jgi:ABC-type sugar transport system ATPase subunit
LYNNPANAFVAGFLGSPGMNLMSGEIRDGRLCVGQYNVGLEVAGGDRPVTVGLRAESVQLAEQGIAAVVVVTEELGADVHVVCETPSGERVVVRQSQETAIPTVGAQVHIAPLAHTYVFDRESGERLS